MDNEDKILECIVATLRDYPGVSRTASGIADNISMNFLGKNPDSVGIKLDEDDVGLIVDIKLIVTFGVKIPELVFGIQTTLRSKLEEIFGKRIKAININIEGVDKDEQR